MKRVHCPSCRREVSWEENPYRPFCSERCRIVDLGNWASERYRVPGETVEPDDTDGADPSPKGSERKP